MNRLWSKFQPLVFFDVAIDGVQKGRVVVEVFTETTPIAAKNFRALAVGYGTRTLRRHSSTGNTTDTDVKLWYKNSRFHRILPGLMIQGGDILYGNGYGSISIYGRVFVDEHFHLSHNRPGLLSMANAGPDTNGCQFFITTQPALHLDNKHVIFGHVICGYDIVKLVEQQGSPTGRPMAEVIMTDCGELSREGYLQEVCWERERLQAKVEERKKQEIFELNLYFHCKRLGIEYVPRAVREMRQAEIGRDYQQEVTARSEQTVKIDEDLKRIQHVERKLKDLVIDYSKT
ncbi:uncharacterized protein LOC126315416 [Schistocerca gregaria]|uniref:uncharacterized protein LOC126315416 n=1 Tax=Schistocerca gregaria TaxID=7010 RepID=UPI00211E16F3|nr:uncharacterized protein LOC126315416 [Schistocerca gregaria]